jgi:hypothetical protein
VHLDALFSSTTLREVYTPIAQGALYPDSHLARYLLRDDTDSAMEPLEYALYLPGYLGEHKKGPQLGHLVLGAGDRLKGYLEEVDTTLPLGTFL